MKVEELEKLAGTIGLLIKIQVRETLGLCFFRIVIAEQKENIIKIWACLLYTSPSPRDNRVSRMPSSA